MSIYQRYLSKSLIFFSIFFIIFLFFIESNIGFKWIFNLTNRFFIGLKIEEISGNWRDFTLKNIKYDVFDISIKANSIHVILDTASLFKRSTVLKEIETKNLTISSKKNIPSTILKKNIPSTILKKNIFIKYPIIFQKIHSDKIFFKFSKVHVFCLNVSSSIKLKNNKIIFLPTYIDAIHLSSKNINSKKKYIVDKLTAIKKFNNTEKIYSFLHFFSNQKKIFIPLNINLISLNCKTVKFLDYKKNNLFQMKLKAQIKNHILKIKKIEIDSSFFKIHSSGKVFFNNDNSITCFIKNEIVIPKFQNRIMYFSFKAHLNINNKFTFQLKSKKLYKIKIDGFVFLNNSEYPFFIKLQIQNLFSFFKKDSTFKSNIFNCILKGKINNYFLSLKNIFTMKGLPSIFIDIKGNGNLQNIFLKKIKFFPIKKTKFYKKIIHIEDNIKYNQYILELIGKIDILGKSDNILYNLCIPNINIDGNIMKKKLSILGSLYYRNFNFLDIPGINFLLGNNKLYIKGSLGEQYNIFSSFYADNLEYFLPNLKGIIEAKFNFNGNYRFPIITSKILSSHLNWNSIYFKKIKILTKMNVNNAFSGNILINAKKINFYDFNINALRIHTSFNNQKQNLSFLLKSNKLYINLMINGIFNNKTGHWNGFFKKIDIKSFFGQVTSKKNASIDYYDVNNNINNLYQKNTQIRDKFVSFFHNTKISLFNIFNKSLVSFKSQLSISAKLKWLLEEGLFDGKVFFTGHDTKLEKKINKKIVFENIDYFKISMNLMKNNFKSKLIVKKSKHSLEKKRIFGYLNITDIYDKKNISGEFTISDFPISFINSFVSNFQKVNGTFKSTIKFFGTVYQPKVSADVIFQNVFIGSNKILKYITLFFPNLSGKTKNFRIHQEIMMGKGTILFTLKPCLKNSSNVEWNLMFNSTNFSVSFFSKIKIKFSSQVNLHYFLSKYDLIGYIKCSLFYFKINEKNFIF